MMKSKVNLALVLALVAAPAAAESTMPGMSHDAHGAMADYMDSMDTMMTTMDGLQSTGNADADFLLMMIPHHQSAIDMARVELGAGQDAETRDLAQKIITAQEQEIADMKAMLHRLGVDVPN